MTTPDDSLNAMLRAAHRMTLGVLVVCAAAAALGGTAEVDVEPPMPFTLAAVGAALLSIIFRRLSTSARIAAGRRAMLAMASLACAGLVGVTGALLALSLGDRQNALLFTVGAVILSLRPPVKVPSVPGAD